MSIDRPKRESMSLEKATISKMWEMAVLVEVLGKSILVGTLLLGAGFTLGCATVVVPSKPGAAAIEDPDHGVVFGRIHVTENGKDHHLNLQWLITEEPHGKRILIDELPIDGPFVVQLPAGSYRLTEVNLDVGRGVWQASLPATFTVRSRECTYLGTWELDLKTDFFSGLITRQVHDQQKRDEDDRRRIIGAGSCPILTVPLASSMETSARLTGQVEGGEQLTAPPVIGVECSSVLEENGLMRPPAVYISSN